MRWGKEECTTMFILVHSITELHQVYQDNLSLVSTIFKSFTNHKPRLHFWTQKQTRFLTHKNLDTQPTRITLADLKSHQANHPKVQEHPNLMVVVLSQPYMCSSSYSQAKMPPRLTKINWDLQSTSSSCVLQKERFPRWMTQFRSEKPIFAPLLMKTRLI